MSYTAAMVIWTYLSSGRRSSTATPKAGHTQLKTRVQMDGKGVYLPRCSLRYAKSKSEANCLRGWTIQHPRWGGKRGGVSGKKESKGQGNGQVHNMGIRLRPAKTAYSRNSHDTYCMHKPHALPYKSRKKGQMETPIGDSAPKPDPRPRTLSTDPSDGKWSVKEFDAVLRTSSGPRSMFCCSTKAN